MAIIRRKPVDESAIVAKIEAPTGAITEAADSAGGGPPEVTAAVKMMALMIYNTVHSFWMSASDFDTTVRDRYRDMVAAFEKNQEVRFTISQQSLMINGVLAEMDNRYIKFLGEHLTRMDVSNFTLTRGMSVEEFKNLISILGKSAIQVAQLGGFAAAIAAGGFKNVEARKIVLKEINEDELVVAKEQVDLGAIERRKQAESDVLAFMSDETVSTTEESVESLREMSREPRKMAEVIVKAADTRRGTAPEADKEERKTVVVHLLERFFDGLMKHPSTRTRTGKKSVEKALEDLKNELLTAIHVGPDDEIAKAVEVAVGQMVEGLKIAGVTADYTRKLKALEDSEKRILRFMKAQGLEKLKKSEMERQLDDSGLDVSGWHRLLAKSTVAEEGGVGDGEDMPADVAESAKAIENLAAILARLEGDIGKAQDDPQAASADQLTGDLKDVNDKVSTLVEGTERKIKDLVDAVTADMDQIATLEKAADMGGTGPKLSRKQMVVTLAEIVQEICQPLAVIRCSIEMVMLARLGQITPAQKNILDLARQGIERIGILAKNLEKISGMPTGLKPDETIKDSLYGRT